MVRFIILPFFILLWLNRFIYIPIWLDLLFLQNYSCMLMIYYLHSNMVRFIMHFLSLRVYYGKIFTFQYGQIYYLDRLVADTNQNIIYIPIWLDLLSITRNKKYNFVFHLHSNMVRFIIHHTGGVPSKVFGFTFQYGQIYYSIYYYSAIMLVYIYIPIWLDLL